MGLLPGPQITWTTETRRLGDLREWDKNPRTLSKHDAEHIKKSLDTFGLADPLIINRDGQLIGGHQRKHILADPETLVDVRVPSRQLTEREAEELAIRLNKAQGNWDWDLLANNWEMDTLIEWGFSTEELHGLDFGDEPAEDPGAQVDKASELQEKWSTSLGQLWQLGEHRLICGDCTDAAVVARVMGGEKAGAVVTDPPYGINREGIENDDPEGLRKLFDGCLEAMPAENAVVIAFQSPRLFPEWLDAIRAYGHKFERSLWMYKKNDVTKPWRGWIMTGEIALISSIGNPEWHEPGEYHHDCYEVNWGKEVDGIHKSGKPLDVIEDLVNHTSGDVYEPFSGSGTTLIACERLGRKCRAVEIAPQYVAVALQRFYDMTGVEPVLVDL